MLSKNSIDLKLNTNHSLLVGPAAPFRSSARLLTVGDQLAAAVIPRPQSQCYIHDE